MRPAVDLLVSWLEALLQEAPPLWPAAETATELPAESWLLTPEPVTNGLGQPNLSVASLSGWSAVHTWAKTRSDLLHTTTAIDGILLLRWRLNESTSDAEWDTL
jgi:hypothetical protein